MNSERSEKITIPVLPLRDVVVYPHMVIPLFIGRKKSINCIEAAIKNNKKIMLIAQKEASQEDPTENDLFNIGTISVILQILKLPDGTVKILIEGLQRACIKNLTNNGNYFIGEVNVISFLKISEKQEKILIRTTINQFKSYIQYNKKIPSEILNTINNIHNCARLSDIITTYIPLKISDKQLILEMNNINEKLEFLMVIMETEINLLKAETRIRNRIKKQIEINQKEYYLNEQMKAIQKELGEIDDIIDDNKILKRKINASKMPKEIKIKVELELKKLQNMPPMSAESTVIRNYIDWMIQVPWNNKTPIQKNIQEAKKILDTDHFGLEKVKERILEYLAVQTRTKKTKGPILCLIGPPGVGKTSLGKSIAKSTGRQYVKMALGGIRDEAEIRGHRRTYIGSMPGKIMQKIINSKTNNPLFLLDEIDKMSYDIRIDPASALLEVLDTEQNSRFNDNYLEVDYDLSNVMFIATANSMNIPIPLLDRMEIIHLSGYTDSEKLNIAKRYLYPKQRKRNSLKKNELKITDCAIKNIIHYYTREAGVRNLEREISKICRKVVKNILLDENIKNIEINSKNLKNFLGIKRFDYGKANNHNHIGQVIGLAWTEVGGELLTIETACVSGKGKLNYTGSLGKIMQESIQAALTVVRSEAKKLNIPEDFYQKNDIHVHVPEGATPKDGPSAGIAICTSIVSSLTKNPIKSNIAMTGEITLCGQVLPIGGLKEKLLAANRSGIKIVIIPAKNKNHLKEIPKNIIQGLLIYSVKNIKEVLQLTLQNTPYI